MYTLQRFPPNLQQLLHYLVKVKKSKNVTDFHSTSTDCSHVPENNLGLDLTFNSS